MSLPFEELEGSPTLSISQQGTIARRVFRVAWDQWPELARRLVGSYRTTACTPVFVPPMPFPGMDNLVVSDIAVEPFDPGNPDGQQVVTLASGTNAYPHAGARVTATYRTQFDLSNQPRANLPEVPRGTYLTYSADMGATYHVMPGRVWRYNTPPYPALPPDVVQGTVIPSGEHRLTWHRVALPPWSTIRDLRGKVNHATFLGSPSGTILFLGARVARRFQFGGDDGFWTVEYQFSERAIDRDTTGKAGWNFAYSHFPFEGDHWHTIFDPSGNFPYRAADFNDLFRFGTC